MIRKATEPSDEEQLHTVKHIAQRAQLSARLLRRDIDSGKLVVHRFGRAIRISESDYQDYLRRCRDKGQKSSQQK